MRLDLLWNCVQLCSGIGLSAEKQKLADIRSSYCHSTDFLSTSVLPPLLLKSVPHGRVSAGEWKQSQGTGQGTCMQLLFNCLRGPWHSFDHGGRAHSCTMPGKAWGTA